MYQKNTGVNRCLKANCSHLCLPTPQNVVCACPTGFAKINETHCEEGIDKFLIFATDKDIRYNFRLILRFDCFPKKSFHYFYKLLLNSSAKNFFYEQNPLRNLNFTYKTLIASKIAIKHNIKYFNLFWIVE